jgi:hypothetical protein
MTPKSTIISLLLVGALLAGCQTTDKVPGGSPRVDWRDIKTLRLHQPLTVYPGVSRAFLQDGQLLREGEVDQRRTWCQFRLYEPQSAMQSARLIDPDEFKVTQASHGPGSWGLSLGFGSLGVGLWDLDASSRTLTNRLKVESTSQPQVFEFECLVFDQPRITNFPTLDSMRESVGGLLTFELM